MELSIEDKWAEISARRNSAETKLRKLVKMLLLASLGEGSGKAEILRIFGAPRNTKLTGRSYSELLDPKVSEMYFYDLAKIIGKHWNLFNNVFNNTRPETFRDLEIMNALRVDAHAKPIDDELFN